MGEKGAKWVARGRDGASWRRRDVFLGLYEHSLDDKGRLVLPRKYRASLEHGCVVAKGHDGSIHVWPRDGFAALPRGSRSSLPPTRGRVRSFRRSLTSTATDQAIDRAGRISLPERLRQYAGLDKDVVVTGADDHLELWSPEAWAEHRGRPTTRSSATWTRTSTPASVERPDDARSRRPPSTSGASPIGSIRPSSVQRVLSGPWSASRMPIGRPLTPPASRLAPALREADHGSDTRRGISTPR